MTSFIVGEHAATYAIYSRLMCLFSILCSAKPQTARTTTLSCQPCLPSQLLPESASALKTQLLSCRLLRGAFVSREALQEPCQASGKLVLCTTEKQGKEEGTRHRRPPTGQPTLWCHFVTTPHPNTQTPQQQLIVQLLLRAGRVWKLSSSMSNCV